MTIVITGASQGIGRSLALAFAAEPQARLALLSRNVAKLDRVAADCRALGAEADVFPCDVTDEEAVHKTAAAVLARWGAPGVLANVAGAFEPGGFRTMKLTRFREQIETNLTSAFLVTQAFIEPMIENGGGHIFFMGSVASIQGYPGGAAYCAAKHGLLGLARVVRAETLDKGVRVTSILPGATLTPSWGQTDLPAERFIPPESVAEATVAAWKLSERAVVEEILIRPQLGDI